MTRSRDLNDRPPPNRQGTIEIELEIHKRAVATLRQEAVTDVGDQLAFSYGVLCSCITDPMRTYSRDQLHAVIRALDRARETVKADR
jgi:hypothetical protein